MRLRPVLSCVAVAALVFLSGCQRPGSPVPPPAARLAQPDDLSAITAAILGDAEFVGLMDRAASLPIPGDRRADSTAFRALLGEAATETAQRVFARHGVIAQNTMAVKLALELGIETRYAAALGNDGGCAERMRAQTAVATVKWAAGLAICSLWTGERAGAGAGCRGANTTLAQAHRAAAEARYRLCADGDQPQSRYDDGPASRSGPRRGATTG